MAARRFYSFDLKEQGDVWLESARAIDPTRARIADVELTSVALAGDDGRLLERVREILPMTLDPETKHELFWPINYYVTVMARTGRAREALDYLVSLVSDLEDYSSLAGDNRGTFYAQGISSWLQQYVMDRESNRTLIEEYIDTLDTAGIPWRGDDAMNAIAMAASMGDLDEAKELFLEHHDSWGLLWTSWWQMLSYPWLEELRADPEVAAILQQHLQDKERIAEELKKMSSRPEWTL